MSQETVEQLEKLLRTLINTKYKSTLPTEEEFLQAADQFRNSMQLIAPVTDEEYESVKTRLRKQIVVKMDVGVCISDENAQHQSWLPARRAEIDPFFWTRYQQYLEEEKGWNPRVVANLGRVADEILDLCGDPKQQHFAIKGLVMGDVQSGKTANYTAICNKAADAGYHVIIVLAGIRENLRRQTQERLDAEFSGRVSKYFTNKSTEPTKEESVGVGRYGHEKEIASFTSVIKDFDTGARNSTDLSIESVNCPVLFVVKKNKAILNNLIKWLADNNARTSQGPIMQPLLLIDDESDNASINTRDMEKDPDLDPTAINDCIRRLLLLFGKSTYLGVTATPFANIFINPENNDDLFPSDFIYALSAPSNYIGAQDIFGDEAQHADMLVRIDDEALELCLPPKHKKTYQVQDLPEDLYEAARYFLLVNAIRDVRGDLSTHRSMMVHISRFNDIQQQIADILNEWLARVIAALRNYAALSAEKAEEIDEIHKLHATFLKLSLDNKAGVSWDCLRTEFLFKAAAPVEVRTVNMRTGPASLDYSLHKMDGLRVIAIGGDSFSRGLTLEGLCVTYFCRTTAMYDTLLQMGRWFGYRPNYADLVKIWMTQGEIDWYGEITSATMELRDEIQRMRNEHKTPREFGLRVKQAPGSLIVTARNKMRTATQIEQPVSVSGRLLETPRLMADYAILEDNKNVFTSFVARLPEYGTRLMDEERTRGHAYWRGVPGDRVADLLRAFQTNLWHLSFNGQALAEYIERHASLGRWDVVLLTKGDGEAYPGGLLCGDDRLPVDHTEKRKVIADGKMLSISGTKVRVGSGGCTRVGLTKQEESDAEAAFRAEFSMPVEKNIPDRAYLTKNRSPILMLHIVEADYSQSVEKDFPHFLFAIGVGFPRTEDETETATYVVNLVDLKNMTDSIGIDDD